jgi:3D (Asp-Asp-Asp) domain-containing protein
MFLKGFYKSKKGEDLLSTQIVKIVLSLIAVVLILYLGVSLGMLLFGVKQDELQAKGTLAYIYQQILSLNETVKIKDVAIYAPNGWTVVAFNNGNLDRNGAFVKWLKYNGKYVVCVGKEIPANARNNFDNCREIPKPLMMEVSNGVDKQTKFFLWKITGVQHFYLSDQGPYYLLSVRSLGIPTTGGYSSPISSSAMQNFQVDSTWKRIEGMKVTVYYTAFEGDFTFWKDPDTKTDQGGMYYCQIPEGKKGFYETVKCEGRGVGINGGMYSYNTIKETKELSPFEANPSCKYGGAKDTCLVPGRSIAVSVRYVIPYLYPVYLQFKCLDKPECQQFCQDFNNHYYVAEDTGSGLDEKQIDLFVGVGKTQYQLAMSCIDNKPENEIIGQPPGVALVYPNPDLDTSQILAQLKEEDKGLNQGVA